MKQIILIRHAKSSWKDYTIDDFDRPLNKRGKRDAPFMAEKLRDRGLVIDLIISSPANRAITTAKTFAEILGYSANNIRQDKSIYEAATQTIISIINELEDEVNTVILFGHNPAFTYAANYLSGIRIDNVPTCGIVCMESSAENWKSVRDENTKFVFFDFPKRHLV